MLEIKVSPPEGTHVASHRIVVQSQRLGNRCCRLGQVCRLLALTLDLIGPWRARKTSQQATALDVISGASKIMLEIASESGVCG